MNLNKQISSRVGLAIIVFLGIILMGVTLYSWIWAGDYLVSIVNGIQ